MALDAGALLFKAPRLSPGLQGQDQATARGIAAAYRAMNYDVVGVNALDLAAGPDFLREIAAEGPPLWLSADLMVPGSEQPLFPAGTTLERGGRKIGIIALTGSQPTPDTATAGQDGLAIRPWSQLLPGLVTEYSETVDFLILLSGLTRQENEQIAALFPQIHLILQAGRDTDANLAPRLLNNSLLSAVGRQGKRVGLLEISWTPDRIWSDRDLEQLTGKRQELDRLSWEWRNLQRSLGGVGDSTTPAMPGPADSEPQSLPTPSVYQQRMTEYQRELQGEIAALKEEISELEQRAGQRQVGFYDSQFISLDQDHPDDPAILRLVEQTKRAINEIGREIGRTQAKQQAERELTEPTTISPYLGWQACNQCHPRQSENWRQTRHAGAYQTLVKRERQYDLACVSCHVTGLYPEEPAKALSLPDALRGVGCEVCHGPGREHVTRQNGATNGQPQTKPNSAVSGRTPAATLIQRRPEAQTCLRCHTEEQSPAFNFEQALSYLAGICLNQPTQPTEPGLDHK